MGTKEEAVIICYGCLSADRNVTPLGELSDLFNILRPQTCMNEDVQLCWECRSILKKTWRFQQRIQQAQLLLQTPQLLINYPTSSLSTLQSKIIDSKYDIHENYNENDGQLELKIEQEDENSDLDDEIHDFIDDEIKKLKEVTEIKDEGIEHLMNDTKIEIEIDQLNVRPSPMSSTEGHWERPMSSSGQTKADDDDDDDDELNVTIDVDNKINDSSEEEIKEFDVEIKDKKSIKRNLRPTKCRYEKNDLSTRIEQLDEFYVKTNLNYEVLKEVMERRLSLKSNLKLRYFCKICEMGFRLAIDLRRHETVLHLPINGPYKCCECDVKNTGRLNTISELQQHLTRHSIYKCCLCPDVFKTEAYVIRHIKLVHRYQYRCLECREYFCTYSEMVQHYDKMHPQFTCDQCGATCRSKKAIESHINKMIDKPGPSKRSGSVLTSGCQAKRGRSICTDNSLDNFECGSVKAEFSQCRDEDFPSEDIQILPPGSPASVETSQNRVIRLDNQPSAEGGTSFWSSQGTIKIIEFRKTQELLVPVPSDPFEAFQLLVDDNILDLIVHETNANATRVLAPDARQHSRKTVWKNITRSELLTFLGLVLHTGTIRVNRLSDYWKKHWLFNIPFAQYMSSNRFMAILRYLHFSSEANEDRLAKIRPVVDNFNNRMNEIYYPGKQLFLDESMVLWRGRHHLRQYIKNERHKYGLKLHVLAESGGTVLKFQISDGADTSGIEHTQKLVLKLLEEKLDSGHSVYMDDNYNSYDLAVQLLNRQTYCTGTLNKNRKGNPIELGTVTLCKGENKSMFLNGVHIGKWKDKRYVLYISTEHDNHMMEVTNKRGTVLKKPSAIIQYNNFMSGVDLQDQMLSYYPCERITMRWYKKIFFHILQMSLSNAFHLYNKYMDSKMNLHDFRLNILKKLLPKPTQIAEKMSTKHILTKIENVKTRQKKEGNKTRTITEVVRKECKICREKKNRVATLYECKSCVGNPGFCIECFFEVHL